MPKKAVTEAVETVAPKDQKPIGTIFFPINDFVSFKAGLLPIARDASKDSAFKNICPSCDTPNALTSRYHCSLGHGPFETSEVKKGRFVGDTLVAATDEQVAEVRDEAELPKGTASYIQRFAAADLEAHTIETGKSYKLRVGPEAAAIAATFFELLQDESVAYVTEFAVRSAPKVYRLRAFNGQIIVSELTRPEDMHPANTVIETKASKANVKQLAAFFETEAYVAEDWSSKRAERAKALDNALDIHSKRTPKLKKGQVAPVETSDDLTALLEAALAASKKGKKGKAA